MERAFLIGPADVIAAADLAALAEPACETFRSEQELTAVTKNWPLRRLVELWNRLPAVVPVRRFENRSIAIGRIWRAILAEGSQASPRSNGKPPKQPRPPREGSKSGCCGEPAQPSARSDSAGNHGRDAMAAAQCARVPQRQFGEEAEA